jgi:hypothetical protein
MDAGGRPEGVLNVVIKSFTLHFTAWGSYIKRYIISFCNFKLQFSCVSVETFRKHYLFFKEGLRAYHNLTFTYKVVFLSSNSLALTDVCTETNL